MPHLEPLVDASAPGRGAAPGAAEGGQTEGIRRCGRCGTRKVELVDLDTWDIIASRMEYPEGYLVKEKGQGRLPRREARKAMFVRSNETLV